MLFNKNVEFSTEHDPHRLCIACRGKSCSPDDRCEECHEWTYERCKSVANYVEKFSLQCGRKPKSSLSSSFSSFSPSIPVPLGQLPSFTDSGVVTTSALSSAVCAVTFTVAGPAVTAAPVISTPEVMPVEHPRKHHRVTDPREQELMMLHF